MPITQRFTTVPYPGAMTRNVGTLTLSRELRLSIENIDCMRLFFRLRLTNLFSRLRRQRAMQRLIRLPALVLVCAGFAACEPHCDNLVGEWQTNYHDDFLKFSIRGDQSLSTIASGEITGGSWRCVADNEALLIDKKNAPLHLRWIDAKTVKILVSKETPGLPEITLEPSTPTAR
jgi:hypothetical protein